MATIIERVVAHQGWPLRGVPPYFHHCKTDNFLVIFSFTGTSFTDYVRHHESVLIEHHDTHQKPHKLITSAHFSAHGRYNFLLNTDHHATTSLLYSLHIVQHTCTVHES